jgi:hypothetical protein
MHYSKCNGCTTAYTSYSRGPKNRGFKINFIIKYERTHFHEPFSMLLLLSSNLGCKQRPRRSTLPTPLVYHTKNNVLFHLHSDVIYTLCYYVKDWSKIYVSLFNFKCKLFPQSRTTTLSGIFINQYTQASRKSKMAAIIRFYSSSNSIFTFSLLLLKIIYVQFLNFIYKR